MRLIDAEALAADLIAKGFYPALVKRAIENAHTIDAVEVVHGRWTEEEFDGDYGHEIIQRCSACGKSAWFASGYCPHCGAQMGAEEAATAVPLHQAGDIGGACGRT